MVEGYTDVLSLSQNDIKNVVSSSGTALTEEQVRLIKRFTQNVTVVYDGDAAGQNAALRGLRIFLENDLNVSLIILPEKEDPDSYVRQLGSKGFREFLQSNSQDFLLYLARQIETEHASNPIQKTQMTRELLENIALLRDHLKRSIYIKECSGLLSISEAQLTREVNKLIRIAINKKNHAKEAVQSGKQAYVDYDPTEDHSQGIRIKLDPQEYQELDILRIIITAGHKLYKPDTKETFADYILVNLEGLEGVIRDIHLKKALKSIRQKEVTGPDYWIYHEDGDIRSMAIDILSENYSYASWSERGYELQTQKMPDENFLRDSFKAVMRFKQKKLQEQIVEFDSLIASEADDLKKLAMLKVSMKLKTDLKEIADHFGSTVI